MGAGFYPAQDATFIDYDIYEHPGGLQLRGPDPGPLAAGGYVAFVGAAQTFGRFCERPFPRLVGEQLGAPVVNLGEGGAGAGFFLGDTRYMEIINQSRFAVVQVMSARGESNSRFEGMGKRSVRERGSSEFEVADDPWLRVLATAPPAEVRKLIAETRASWVRSNRALLRAIRVPVVLLYISKRRPDYRERLRQPPDLSAVWGEFPQLVNRAMVDAVRPHAAAYVECVSRRGSPQRVWDRSTGGPLPNGWTENGYYPSPEMHEDAARLLLPACRALWTGGRPPRATWSRGQDPRSRAIRRLRTVARRIRRRLTGQAGGGRRAGYGPRGAKDRAGRGG